MIWLLVLAIYGGSIAAGALIAGREGARLCVLLGVFGLPVAIAQRAKAAPPPA